MLYYQKRWTSGIKKLNSFYNCLNFNGNKSLSYYTNFLPLNGDLHRDKIAMVHAENKPSKYNLTSSGQIRDSHWSLLSVTYFKVNHENI